MLMVMVTDLSGPGSGLCSGFLSGSLGPRRRKPLAAIASRSDSTKGRASIAVGTLQALPRGLAEQDQAPRAEVKQCLLILSAPPHPRQCGYQSQEQSRLNSRAPEHRQTQQRERCGCERKLLAKWNPARAGS